MKVKSESKVAQLCPTLRDPMDCSLPGSSVHGISQARVLEWGAIAFSIDIWVLKGNDLKALYVEFHFLFNKGNNLGYNMELEYTFYFRHLIKVFSSYYL